MERVGYQITHVGATEALVSQAAASGITVHRSDDLQFGGKVLITEAGKVCVVPSHRLTCDFTARNVTDFWDEVWWKKLHRIRPLMGAAILDTNTGKELGKTPYSLVHAPFIAAMARNLQEGIKNGRKRDDWQRMEWNPEVRAQYMDALQRHTLEGFDAAAIACNAMIIAYHDGRQNDDS